MGTKWLPLTDDELAAPITKANFARRADRYIRVGYRKGQAPTIAYKPLNPSEEWQQWRQYFERHLQWLPLVMQRMLDRSPSAPAAMTVPAQFPWQFDPSFHPLKAWAPPPTPTTPERSLRDRLDELQRRYGPNWGIKDMPKARHRLRTWTPPANLDAPTDDDLRRLYGGKRSHTE